MATDNYDKYKLTELSGSGFEVADGEDDIRDWQVISDNAVPIGKIADLIVDPLSRNVRYLVINIDGKPINLQSRKILLPIGLADLDRSEKQVIVNRVDVGQLATLPTYKKDLLNPGFEKSIREVLSGRSGAPASIDEPADYTDHDRFYDHDHFNDRRFYNPHERRTISQEDELVDNDRLRHEERSNHRPDPELRENWVDNPAYRAPRRSERDDEIYREEKEKKDLAPFEEGSIEFVERKEVPVVTKSTHVVEEVDINKNVSHRDEVIRDKVKRREVDVEEFDADGNRIVRR